MDKRTFYRVMVDNLFLNNPFCKTIRAIVNYCNEKESFRPKKLKFSQNVPLINIRNNEYNYKSKFIFSVEKSDGVYSK